MTAVERQVADTFPTDVARHEMTVLHDDGLYRHLRFARPDDITLWWEVITWPGTMVIRGDMGTYVFARDPDMIPFFNQQEIKPWYWAEKVQGSGEVTEWHREAFEAAVHDQVQWTCQKCLRVISRRDEESARLRQQLAETEKAHGAEHRLFSFGWTTQGSTCFLQDAENLYEAASEAFDRARRTIAPGRYPVDWDADDTSLNLYLLETEARS